MDIQNVVLQPIPEETIAKAMDLLKQSFALISPYMSPLTPEDRKKMLKMSNGTEPFVTQGSAYIDGNKDLVPNYVSADKLNTGYGNFNALFPMLSLLTEYCSQVSDTKMVSGGVAYSQVLSFYDAIKTMAKQRVAGAKTIYTELKKRFAKKKKKSDKEAA